ncbi:LytR/AlgR family response regulator transcription factor [Xylocopilactobacillus apicola]|uniref:DNA-binding response regulator n=1 Tax=Xylocopilactobacillus apicola TaxID=2932184 RepID=A0AAU9DVZ1_9LACO|nr:LytTR family DNA-binding domain-containing protein [Xylocopilactobacillus apicola]BDR58098.1 DNA-binding response regulator [Xylocopilactobacillus apicola]
MKIFICDDQEIHLLAIKKIVESLIACKDAPMSIAIATTEFEEIISNLETNGLNIYFLDIDLNNDRYNGIDLALKIRQIDPLGFIIFITSYFEYGMLTFEYKIGAFDYIIKSLDSAILKEKINNVLNAVAQRHQFILNNQEKIDNDSKSIKFVSDYEEQFVLIEELIMLEMIGNHKLQVITKDRIFECNGTLGGFESKLPNYFFRCHRSVIINLKKVIKRSIKDESFVLSNGAEVQCSTRKQKKCIHMLDNLNI